MSFRDKKDEDSGRTMFTNLDKATIVQEARVFNETPLNPKKCCGLLSKVLYLIYGGEAFSSMEATSLFFSVTKAFQSKEPYLRRMVYLVIKELAEMADDVIMVTSSLTQDITGGKLDNVHRANALRVLCKIIEPSMIQSVERVLKQCIVDKSNVVASAALVSSFHLFRDNKEVVKRWVNEAQQRLSTVGIVQYHAFGLTYQIKHADRMSIIKLISQASNASASMYATCLFIRCYAKLFEEQGVGLSNVPEVDLKPFLRHKTKSEMVSIEAARATARLPEEVARNSMLSAIAVLQLHLTSPKTVVRFAAIRTLNDLANNHAVRVAACNHDIEGLVSDPNRSIATLAITTLLKTGNEASIDRLMKQLTSFMYDLPDEFKIIVIDAINALCVKFPGKHENMLAFLGNALRDPGGFEYKKGIVDCIVRLMRNVPQCKDQALSHLCEFIEDCEFPKLGMDVLNLLGFVD